MLIPSLTIGEGVACPRWPRVRPWTSRGEAPYFFCKRQKRGKKRSSVPSRPCAARSEKQQEARSTKHEKIGVQMNRKMGMNEGNDNSHNKVRWGNQYNTVPYRVQYSTVSSTVQYNTVSSTVQHFNSENRIASYNSSISMYIQPITISIPIPYPRQMHRTAQHLTAPAMPPPARCAPATAPK